MTPASLPTAADDRGDLRITSIQQYSDRVRQI